LLLISKGQIHPEHLADGLYIISILDGTGINSTMFYLRY